MSKVTPFPSQRIVGSRLHPRKPKRKRGQLWKLADLDGSRPRGHVAPKFTKKGKVILAVGQVWVVDHCQELVVITQIDRDCASHEETRAQVLVERIELFNAAERWEPQAEQLCLAMPA